MRIKLSNKAMDIVMHIVRKYDLTIEQSVEFIIENPDLIVFTRGEINGSEKATVKTQKDS